MNTSLIIIQYIQMYFFPSIIFKCHDLVYTLCRIRYPIIQMIPACVMEVGVVDQSAWNVDLPEEALVLVKVIRIVKTAVIEKYCLIGANFIVKRFLML